jgi:tRNA pseudouridine13 synthase
LEKRYIKEKAWYEISFILPKGSYATVLIEILKNGITDRLVNYKGNE